MTKNLGASDFKSEILKGDQIIQPFLRTGPPKQIRFPLLNSKKHLKSEKSTAELCRIH